MKQKALIPRELARQDVEVAINTNSALARAIADYWKKQSRENIVPVDWR
jgi:hypothetical protein